MINNFVTDYLFETEIVMDNDNGFKVRKFKKIPQEQLQEIIDSFIEVELIQPFQVIRETLSRIGVLQKNTLYETAHILHKKERYYIVHFLELFMLDGRESTLTPDDKLRVYKIAHLLFKWNMIKFVKQEDFDKAEAAKDVYVNIVKTGDARMNMIKLEKKYAL